MSRNIIVRVFLSVILFSVAWFVYGCGGGGGGASMSPFAATDTGAITATVQGFLRAVVEKKPLEAGKYLSRRLQVAGTGTVIAVSSIIPGLSASRMAKFTRKASPPACGWDGCKRIRPLCKGSSPADSWTAGEG